MTLALPQDVQGEPYDYPEEFLRNGESYEAKGYSVIDVKEAARRIAREVESARKY